MSESADPSLPPRSLTQRYFSSLGYLNYRRLFFSTSLAGLANWTLVVGRGWLAFHLTGSSSWVGLVTFASFLPFLLGPFGGVLADRYERKRLAAISTGVGSVLSLLLAVLTIAGSIEAWQLAVITLVMSVPRAAELPARQALIANTVPEDELLNAVSLSSVATFGTRAVGPAIVVPLIAGIGVGGVFLLAAVFYLMASFAILRVGAAARAVTSATVESPNDVGEVLRFIIGTPTIAVLMLLVMCHCSLTMSFDALLPVFAVQDLHAGGASFSAMAMGVGIGALAGSLWIAGVRTEEGRGRMMLVTAVLSGLTPMAMALPMEIMSLPVAVGSMIAMGATQGAFMSIAGALVQVAAPDRLRGRVSSIYLLLAGGLMAWMNLINGSLADKWEAPLLFLVPAIIYMALLVGLTAFRPPLRTLFRAGVLIPAAAT